MRAVILERNKLVGRRVARLFHAAGLTAETVEEPSQLGAALDTADIVCCDVFDADFVAEQVRGHKRLRGVLWTAEPLKRALRHLVDTSRIDHVLARKDFESAPRSWEVAMLARRLVTREAPPIAAYVDWGHSVIELDVATTADRDHATAAISDFVLRLAVPRRVADMFAELGHDRGKPKYAGDRKADLRLADREKPTVRIASDGSRLVMQVRDPFGRLERRHVLDGLGRGLAGGEMDRSNGGAGLGMAMCHNASTAMYFDVSRGNHTEVTAVFELDMNLRELRTQAKSLQLWSS
jgi:hypothetical protein